MPVADCAWDGAVVYEGFKVVMGPGGVADTGGDAPWAAFPVTTPTRDALAGGTS